MKTALVIKTADGQTLGIVINDDMHQITVNRSITNVMRRHANTDDITFDPNLSEQTVKTKRGTFTFLIETVNIY